MASSSGNSSGSQLLQNSGSEGDLQHVMDQRKRKRMQSNRESARRSRMRKQQHLDELTAQVTQLRKENGQILTSINITTQHYTNVEAENSVLRAQMAELSQRLESLTEILNYINGNNNNGVFETEPGQLLQTGSTAADHNSFMNPWNNSLYSNQPIMAAADMLQY
ncbi:putative transcription factor bZIP family [Rosa chinensis]|uniref:Putative transcription factor bZIP family n=1 Tax=Rosa chinensis TaxID=74649 RepID=A0A2P6PYV1_ROSCH|nr:bZIP transcription factor 11 [Rosa chinensis]PRQ27094.1 putative transcription factor bZIP family [Rosa chinensis]